RAPGSTRRTRRRTAAPTSPATRSCTPAATGSGTAGAGCAWSSPRCRPPTWSLAAPPVDYRCGLAAGERQEHLVQRGPGEHHVGDRYVDGGRPPEGFREDGRVGRDRDAHL